ncbi:MAG: hypothetical protein U0804_28625 [Gemmataceae bacterium]
MKPEPITLTFAGTDGEPGVGITAYGLLLWPPGASLATPEPEPVKIADGMSEANAAEVVRRWNAYPDLQRLLNFAKNVANNYDHEMYTREHREGYGGICRKCAAESVIREVLGDKADDLLRGPYYDVPAKE